MSTEGDPLTTLEDVMAFIDGFDATQDLESSDDSLSKLSSSSGFSSDNEGNSSLLERSSELLGVLGATMLTATTVDTEASPMRQRRNRHSSASSTDSRSPRVVLAAATDAKLLAKKTHKTNVYREKMKRELQYLRVRAAEMEEQLTALRLGTPALSSTEKQLIDSSWKRIAENQLAALKESEAENARLKAVLLDHVAMSKTLEQSLGKRVDAAYMANEANVKKVRGRSLRSIGDGDFEALASGLDAVFERLDQVMQESGLTDATPDVTLSFRMKTRTLATGVATPYTELTETQVNPFEARLTAKALWKAVRNLYHRKLGNSSAGNVWQTGNTFAAKCQYTFKNECGQDVNLNSKIVLRKYTDEENRMVLVWRANSECGEDPGGVYADETGWSVVQPISGSFGHAASGSVIRTLVHVVHRNRMTSLVLDPRATLQHPSVGKLTDLVMASNEEDMAGITKAMETLLLDEGDKRMMSKSLERVLCLELDVDGHGQLHFRNRLVLTESTKEIDQELKSAGMATNRHGLSSSSPPPPSEGLLDDVLSFYQTLPPVASLSSPTGVSVGGPHANSSLCCPSQSASSSLVSSSLSCSSESSESEEDQLLAESEQLLRILDAAVASPLSRSSPLPGNEGNARVTPVDGVASVALVIHGERTDVADTERGDEGAGLQITRSAAKPNRHRGKMKREAEYLRNCVRELESELKALHQGTVTESTRLKNNAIMSAAWQRISKSQQGLRLTSEAENRNLKRELRLHLEMTRGMAQTLGKRLNSLSSLQSVVAATRKWSRGSKGDAEFFQDLVVDLDVAFGRLDCVFKNNGLDKVATELRRTVQTRAIRDCGGAGAGTTQFVEMCNAQVAPFAMWMTANASWESTAKQFVTRRYGQVECVWRSKDVIASAFCMQGQAPLRGRVAVKKYFDDAHRLVLVWRGHTECAGGFSEYIADETGWAVFEPLSSKPGHANSGSFTRTCVQFVQRHQSSVARAEGLKAAEVDRFTDVILSWHEETMTELSKLMENLLLDDVTGATGGGAGSLQLIQ